MAFTRLLPICSSSFTNGSPQDVTTTSWSTALALRRGIELTNPFMTTSFLKHTDFQWLFLTNTTSLFTGLSKYSVELSYLSEAPINNLTLRALPLLSLYTFTIQAIGHSLWSASCLSNTVSLTRQFRFWLFHFFLFWRVSRTSFLHLPQNPLDTSYL